ncbi:MAG TPA: cytochrome c-type biogenesis protein CcmH [Candidatus Krumholzibacteria bacterium]|nr:cytochrome c-type biogenesis protein CcmH [Candidatus Krumholzibacteria bacterium]
MKRSLMAAALLLMVIAPAVPAGYGSGDPRLETLYTSFVAPCCWRDNLALHESPRADELRTRIAAMVDAGKSDEEIKAAIVQEFGKRILVVPEGGTAGWLFRTPGFLGVVGLLVVVFFLRRMRHTAVPVPDEPGAAS